MSKYSGSLRNRCGVKKNAELRGKLKKHNARLKKKFGKNPTLAIEFAKVGIKY